MVSGLSQPKQDLEVVDVGILSEHLVAAFVKALCMHRGPRADLFGVTPFSYSDEIHFAHAQITVFENLVFLAVPRKVLIERGEHVGAGKAEQEIGVAALGAEAKRKRHATA